MNINWYYSFITLASTLNYRKASKIIHLTEPTIYKQIKNLEHFLDLKLFDVAKKKLYLTEEGKFFLPLAKSFLKHYENDLEQIKLYTERENKVINIVVSPYIATYLMPKFLPYFFANQPHININIHIENHDIEKLIKDEVFDVGISREMPILEDVISEKICEGNISLFVPNIKENYNSSEIDLFKKYKILSDNHPTYWVELKKSIKKLIPSAQFVSINDVSVTEKLLLKNQGISFLPTYISTLNNNQLLKINTKIIPPPVSFTYIFTKSDTDTIALFKNEFCDFIKSEQELNNNLE